jgi:acyl dehydratase
VRTFKGLNELNDAVGEELGHSDWLLVDQGRVNAFAAATGDHQWIHTDAERARSGPFGATIAHGYLTVALLPTLLQQIYQIEDVAMSVNYGADRLRFPSPLRTGSKVRATAVLASAEVRDDARLVTIHVTIQAEGEAKPVCVVDALALVVASTTTKGSDS